MTKINSSDLFLICITCFCWSGKYSANVSAFATPKPITFKQHPTQQAFRTIQVRPPSFLNMAFKEPPVKEKLNEEQVNEAIAGKENNKETSVITEAMEPIMKPIRKEIEDWEQESKTVEMVALGTWLASITAFIFVNNFVGPWPAVMSEVPREIWGLTHALSAMLFGGGIILTTAFEWLVTSNKNKDVLSFYFDKVPFLDAMIVLPALTGSMISGTGLSIAKYDGLGLAPPHVKYTLWCLTAFASWWALTDLSTQGSALKAINEWKNQDNMNEGVPKIIDFRKFSNVVSCGFVLALYYIMVMKPGFTA